MHFHINKLLKQNLLIKQRVMNFEFMLDIRHIIKKIDNCTCVLVQQELRQMRRVELAFQKRWKRSKD